MSEKLDELIKLYHDSDKRKWEYHNSELILSDEKEDHSYIITIGVFKHDGEYSEFIFIDDKERLLFKGLLYSTNDINKLNYDYFKNELNRLNLNQLIEKYYDILKENFL